MERKFATTRTAPNASAHAYGNHHTCGPCTSGRLAAIMAIDANGSRRRPTPPPPPPPPPRPLRERQARCHYGDRREREQPSRQLSPRPCPHQIPVGREDHLPGDEQ